MKVEIRKTKITDAKSLHEIINNKEVIKELSGYPFPCQLGKIKRDIKKGIREWTEKKAYSFTILADKKIVGQIFLENPSKDKKRYDLGFFIGKNYWNKGIATKAIKQLIHYGSDKLKLYRIQADNDSDNLGSGRAMEKAGMIKEGVRKKIMKKKGKFIDLVLWGITK